MPKKTQKRDTAYYLEQVEKRHPAVYAQYRAGHFKSAAAAVLAAGVRQPPQQIHALKRAWRKASAAERREFVDWLKATMPRKSAAAPLPTSISIATADNRLTEDAKKRFRALFPAGPIESAPIMRAIGQSPHNVSLSGAVLHNETLQPDVIKALEVWLPAEEARRRGR